MTARPWAAIALVAAALGTPGCSALDGPAPPPATPAPPPATGSGWFVGAGPGGLGAALDLEGEDPVTAAVDRALRAVDGVPGSGPVVGVASLVNDGARAVRAPSFIATFAGGGAVPLPDAREVLARAGDGPAVRRARALLGPPPAAIAPGAATTLYVVLRGAAPAEVAAVRIVVEPGRTATLSARPR